jgi:hypothetical protein
VSVHPDPRDDGTTFTRDDATVDGRTRDSRSLPDLLGDLVNQLSALFRTETSLLKAEMRENARTAAYGGAEIGAGAMLVFASLVILLIALVHAVDAVTDIGYGWASLAVGIVFSLIGALLIKRGKDNISQSPIPDRTQRSVGKDMRLVKEEAR